MLGAIAYRLGQEKVREQLSPPGSEPDAEATSFAGRLGVLARERRLSLLLCLAGRPRSIRELGDICQLDPALASEDLELLRSHGLVERSPDGEWRACCDALARSVERLVDLILSHRERERSPA